MQEIHKWREEIKRLKADQEKCAALLKERETLESDFLKTPSPLLKEKLRQIDATIDQLGEDHEELIKQASLHLQSLIVEQFPHAIPELSVLDIKSAQSVSRQNSLEKLLTALQPLSKALTDAYSIHQNAEKRTLLDKLFGRHPQVLLSHQIYKALDYAKAVEKEPMLPQELKEFMEEFKKEAETRWNANLYKERLPNLYRQFKHCHEVIEESLVEVKNELALLSFHFDAWCHKEWH